MNAVTPLLPRSLLEHEMRCVGLETDAAIVELLADPPSPNQRLHEAMLYATLDGGKRLRPLLVVASARLFKVPRPYVIRAGLAVECVHVQSLIHDDLPCMDDGQTRRGKPTLHRQFDEATAVIAGDALLAQAFQVLADERTHLNPLVRAELIQELALAVGPAGMAAGQMFDLDEPAGAPELAEIIRTQYLKTGALITWAVLAGAMLARAPLAARNALRNYAYCLGLAFQIADDLLDATGDVRLGKDTGQDAAHNKATLVTLLGTAKARERANALVAKAKRYLGCFGGEAALLRDIADFAVTRTR